MKKTLLIFFVTTLVISCRGPKCYNFGYQHPDYPKQDTALVNIEVVQHQE